jgi:predicted nucleic acid-binding protein
MKLADTTLLMDHARGDEAVGAFLDAHADEAIAVSTLSLQELAVGEVLARDQSLQAILGHLGAFDVLEFTAKHAYAGAGIEATLRSNDTYEPAFARDVLIGGVARALSVPVVTRDASHFARFDGVHVESY